MINKEVVRLLFVVLVFTSLFFIGCEKEETPKVKVAVKLEENPILNGETTNLILEVRNVGSRELNGRFNVTPEDSELVLVSYAGEETFRIISGESVKKSYELTGKTRTYETGVQIKVDLIDLGNNSVLYSNDDLVLYVKKE